MPVYPEHTISLCQKSSKLVSVFSIPLIKALLIFSVKLKKNWFFNKFFLPERQSMKKMSIKNTKNLANPPNSPIYFIFQSLYLLSTCSQVFGKMPNLTIGPWLIYCKSRDVCCWAASKFDRYKWINSRKCRKGEWTIVSLTTLVVSSSSKLDVELAASMISTMVTFPLTVELPIASRHTLKSPVWLAWKNLPRQK